MEECILPVMQGSITGEWTIEGLGTQSVELIVMPPAFSSSFDDFQVVCVAVLYGDWIERSLSRQGGQLSSSCVCSLRGVSPSLVVIKLGYWTWKGMSEESGFGSAKIKVFDIPRSDWYEFFVWSMAEPGFP